MKTIKQLADELEVSKTAVRKYMTDEFRAAHTAITAGGIITIDDAGCKWIAERLQKPSKSTANHEPETTENQVSVDMVKLLQSTIEALQQQLEVKDRQIAELTETVKAQAQSISSAQALHAGTMQQVLSEPYAEAPSADDQEPKRAGLLGWLKRKGAHKGAHLD